MSYSASRIHGMPSVTMTEAVCVVGLGSMGRSMALRLAEQGVTVTGFDLSLQAREAVQSQCSVVSTLADAVRDHRTVILSLPTSRQVESVVEGAGGLLETAAAPTLIIDMSTSDPRSTVRLANKASALGHQFVDAPVSGGPARARDGTLAIAIGGADSHRAQARLVLEKLARVIVETGAVGSAHLGKLVNNFLCATQLAVAGDLFRFVTASGYSADRAVELVNAASGRSQVTELNFPRWILSGAFDSGFTMALMSKDATLMNEIAGAAGMSSALLESIAARWEAEQRALGDFADFNRIAALKVRA